MRALLAGIYLNWGRTGGHRVMAYTWFTGYRAERQVGQNHEEVPLTSISSNEVLRRVVLFWRIHVVSQDSSLVFDWLEAGVISLVEFTVGNPPPTPQSVTLGEFDTRDILFSQLEFPGSSAIFTGNWAVPANGMSGMVDVEISRRPAPDAGIVWWSWGVAPPGASPIGYLRAWWRVLIES
jgi:hypothetical protein